MKVSEMVGDTVLELLINQEKTSIKFVTDVDTYTMFVTAGCCSTSWIENVTGVQDLIGQQITGFGHAEMEEDWYWAESYKTKNKGDDVIQYYSFKIKTSKGVFEIEFRNESNGYYGADLELMKSADFLDEENLPWDHKGDDVYKPLVKDF